MSILSYKTQMDEHHKRKSNPKDDQNHLQTHTLPLIKETLQGAINKTVQLEHQWTQQLTSLQDDVINYFKTKAQEKKQLSLNKSFSQQFPSSNILSKPTYTNFHKNKNPIKQLFKVSSRKNTRIPKPIRTNFCRSRASHKSASHFSSSSDISSSERKLAKQIFEVQKWNLPHDLNLLIKFLHTTIWELKENSTTPKLFFYCVSRSVSQLKKKTNDSISVPHKKSVLTSNVSTETITIDLSQDQTQMLKLERDNQITLKTFQTVLIYIWKLFLIRFVKSLEASNVLHFKAVPTDLNVYNVASPKALKIEPSQINFSTENISKEDLLKSNLIEQDKIYNFGRSSAPKSTKIEPLKSKGGLSIKQKRSPRSLNAVSSKERTKRKGRNGFFKPLSKLCLNSSKHSKFTHQIKVKKVPIYFIQPKAKSSKNNLLISSDDSDKKEQPQPDALKEKNQKDSINILNNVKDGEVLTGNLLITKNSTEISGEERQKSETIVNFVDSVLRPLYDEDVKISIFKTPPPALKDLMKIEEKKPKKRKSEKHEEEVIINK